MFDNYIRKEADEAASVKSDKSRPIKVAVKD